MTGMVPKFKTEMVDMSEFGGEGFLEVRGVSVGLTKRLAKISKDMGDPEGVLPETQMAASYEIFKSCVINPPFELTDEVIDELPMQLISKVAQVATGAQKDLPLE